MTRRVAVIGAGCAGLTSIKCCLDEGLVPVCFESSDDIGGLWRFKEKPEPGRANIYRSLVINSSKEMMSYSDFPPPADLPNNMHHSQLLQYLRLYAEHFDLLQHIRFQTNVCSVKQRSDFPHSGQWEVETETKEGDMERHIFDAVMICTGHYTQPHLPLEDFPGIDTFKGQYFHSWKYGCAESLQGKRVVVVGIGNSGGDIAVDSSRVAEQVYLSTRRGTWVMGRLGDSGLPCDVNSGARLAVLLQRYLPSWAERIMEQKLNQRFDHRLYGLLPPYGFFKQIPLVNDDLPGRIISGRVVVKPNVREFRGSTVVFEDGSVVEKVDVVVFATGYNYDFPFLPPSLKAKAGFRLSLYKQIFPPSLEQPTLAVIGFIHALGAIIPWQRCRHDGQLESSQVDYIPYLDDLAGQVGALPNFLGLLLRDPRLGLNVLLGPCTPYQYRLYGPGQWTGARQAILTQWDRVIRPFKTRTIPEPRQRTSDTMARRVAVIGAGSSGLACIKCCLDEGLVPVCFESSDDIGGLWRFKENPEPDRASIYHSVIINTCKEMMCFSDFPIPDDFPNYMHNSLIMDYFRMYADHFQLRRHIRFQTRVCSVNQRPDFSRSGQWEVQTENKEGHKEKHIFDAVMIAVGHHAHPNLPLKDFPGIETFKGKYFHSRDYKTPEEWREKRVVVIGIGNSGGDIAVELSRMAKQVFLSTRRGAWILNRVGDSGVPLDMQFNRLFKLMQSLLPFGFFCSLAESRLNQRFNHNLYSLQPKHRLFSQHPTVNDELPNRILSGTVLVKPNIRKFQGSSVVFDDGTVEDDIDLVVFATGYTFSFPFLSSSVLSVADNKTSLYKYVYPPGLERPTLAVIGLVQPLGAIMPIAEMQARWATRVFKGLNKLPPMDTMMKDIKGMADKMAMRYVTSQRHTIQVDYILYMDDLARQVGVLPSFLRLLLRDPRLGLSVLLGPCTPYQYRLYGPGQWAGARQAILTQWDRVAKPMKTRPVPECKRSSTLPLLLTMSGAALLATLLYNQEKVLAFLQDPAALLDSCRTYFAMP
ncbi:hypothetical protein AGOR_G00149770 [Albula goreensis]|uniref:Flavin-containing monooxygenase n=1 Tax=Albula goreensis TaxID=1534307 RepID=A0A8T3DAY9_9TELE|nr:hypothetical protein AGOR_G00149770 [Albula goreensis]